MAKWDKLELKSTVSEKAEKDINGNQITSTYATKTYVDEQCAKASGTVKSVNNISSDVNGNIYLSCYRCETFNFYTKENPNTPIPYKIMLSSS